MRRHHLFLDLFQNAHKQKFFHKLVYLNSASLEYLLDLNQNFLLSFFQQIYFKKYFGTDGIREMLSLNKPIYEKTSAYGHFGREPEKDGAFSWENTDKMSIFNK